MNGLLFCDVYVLVEYHCIFVRIPSKTCAQQVHVHSSQTDKLINIIDVYMPMIWCCGRFWAYHIIWGDGRRQEDANMSSLASTEYGHIIICASKRFRLKVEVNKTKISNILK